MPGRSCPCLLVLGDPARLGRLAHMTPPAHTCPNVCLQNITKPNDCSVWVGDTAIAVSQPEYSKCFLKMPKPRYIYIKMLKTENFSFIVIGLTEIGYLDNAIGFSTIKYPDTQILVTGHYKSSARAPHPTVCVCVC